MMYELVIMWSDGEKLIEKYCSQDQAEEALNNYKLAFGKQVSWSCIRPEGVKHHE